MVKSYQQALNYLKQLRPKTQQTKFPGNLGLLRAKYLSKKLKNPQNKLKIIHVAGTSGKGSTTYFTSMALKSQGFNVGLTQSPHILDIRERIQINNRIISRKEFVKLLNQVIPAIELTSKYQKGALGMPTFFEVLIAMAFLYFYHNSVDYAVIETGLGGLYDGTNVVNRQDKIVIITKIGFDHTHILGKTLSDIAKQKCGIIYPGNQVITCKQLPQVHRVISATVNKKISHLITILPEKNYKFTGYSNNKSALIFDFKLNQFILNNIIINNPATYKVENAALALTCFILLANRDNFKIKEIKLRIILANINLSGRFFIEKLKNKTLILDGAHNPQKMTALIKSIQSLYPGEKFHFLCAFKENKDYLNILNKIPAVAKDIVFTKFTANDQDMVQKSVNPSNLANYLKKLKFVKFTVEPDFKKALIKILQNKDQVKVVITGSIYLLSKIYPLLEKTKN